MKKLLSLIGVLILTVFGGQAHVHAAGKQVLVAPRTLAINRPTHQPKITPTPTVTVTPTPPATTKPVIIIVPGYGSGLTPDDYSYVINSMLAQGYTVLKYYPTYEDISNYSYLVNVWSQGVGNLAGKKRVIVIGHSVGGAVAMHFCATDTRCAASIDLDGGVVQYAVMHVPNLYLQGEVGAYCDQGCLDGRTLASRITMDSHGLHVFMQGLKHMNFTDYALRQTAYPNLVSQGYFGIIDGQTGLNQINAQISTFLITVH